MTKRVIYKGGQAEPALVHDEHNDYTLTGSSCWITVDALSVWVRRDGSGGVIVEVYRHFDEAGDCLEALHVPG